MGKKVYWFYELNKGSIDIAGGKGANLGEMVQEKFPIPPGFALSSPTYFEFLDRLQLRHKITDILKGIDADDSAGLQEAAKRIQDIIKGAEMPGDIADTVLSAYDELAKNVGEQPLVAVRSSATAEDLPKASFAGQQVTYLNVDRDGLVDAVKKCWASLFTARAIFYRENQDFEHMKVGISVIVQQMVQSESSGVVFTTHPTGETDQVIVEAVFGLGEGIVSGRYTPDHYEVEPSSWDIAKKDVAAQKRMIILDAEKKGVREVEVSPEKQAQQKLPDDKVVELARICKRIEKHYGQPQDIEWAYEGGKLYIVQSRPVTTIPKDRKRHEDEAMVKRLKPVLKGLAASPGISSGPVKIIHSAEGIDKIKDGDVLVTEMTNPDMVPAMKRAAAIVTDEGGMTSHAAIVSRELGIPAIVGTQNATKTLKPGEDITVDGKRGMVYRGKKKDLLVENIPKGERESAASYVPTGTNIMVNLSSPGEAKRVAARHVDGVGLLRAEFMVADIGIHPKEAMATGKAEEFVDRLASDVSEIARAFWPRPVIYRSFDFKTNEYRSLKGGKKYEPDENNPMIGYRGAMRAINDPDVFELEIRMIKKVREEQGMKNLWLMMPFIRTVDEVHKVKEVMRGQGLLEGRDFKFFLMAEVPSVALLIDEFAQVADGFSIGSNDLTQLVLGADRDNEKLAETFDERDPAVLDALRRIITGAKRNGKYVSICGQAPSVYPEIVEHLVRWGVDSISVNPDVIERTRRMVAQVERKVLLESVREG